MSTKKQRRRENLEWGQLTPSWWKSPDRSEPEIVPFSGRPSGRKHFGGNRRWIPNWRKGR